MSLSASPLQAVVTPPPPIWALKNKTPFLSRFSPQGLIAAQVALKVIGDSPITKALMVQVKAQLGKNWNSCADLSLNELKALRFRQCGADEMTKGHNGRDYEKDNKESFQFASFVEGSGCMDLTEFRSAITSYVGEISDKEFQDELDGFIEGLIQTE
jgi:hypothetical protein